MRYFLFEILLLIFFSWVVLQMEPTAWLIGQVLSSHWEVSYFFNTGSCYIYIAQNVLKLQSFYLYLPSVGITDMHYHTQLVY